MKPMHRSFAGTSATLLASALLAPALLLSGCGGNVSFPDTVVPGTAQQTPLGTIQGSVYGGHAPLTQAHLYVLEPQATGYGNQAKSLLTAGGTSPYVNTQNSGDPGVPSGAYYQSTQGDGSFNISGDYTCDPGYPVYLYAYGGYPDFPQSSGYNTNNTFSVSSVSVSGSGPYTYTFTFTTQSFNFQGQGVYFNQAYGPFSAGSQASNTNAYTVVSAPAPGQITLQSSTNSSSSISGLQLSFAIPYNTAAVNLAVLGICPTSGSIATGGPIFNGTTSSALKYVYMNEVSTVAAAYAFAPFSANGYYNGQNFPYRSNYASYIGTSSTNLVGLQNAALNAGMLYSVNGSGPISTTFAGDGHIANAATPTGNGIINQAVIDTVANILAACVDSDNSAGTGSTQCDTLFQYATQTGIPTSDPSPGTSPYDTATAAINIALHPQGPPSTDTNTTPSAWVTALYNLATGNVPFSPNLTGQPNDFTIGILYPEANNGGSSGPLNSVSGVAVDKIGELWFTTSNSSNGTWFEMSPQGIISNIGSFAVPLGPPVIDSQSNVWFQPQLSQSSTYFLRATSTTGNPYTYNSTATAAYYNSTGGYQVFAPGTMTYFGDHSGNMYFIHDVIAGGQGSSTSSGFYLSYFPAITGPTNVPMDTGETLVANFVNTNHPINAGALDNSGYGWLLQDEASLSNSNIGRVGQVPSASTSSFYLSGSSACQGLFAPTGIAITRYGNAIVATSNQYAVTFVTSSGTCTQLANSSGSSFNRQGPGSFYPVAEATDGNDFVYSLNQESGSNPAYHQGSITVFNLQGESGGASSVYAMNYALSPVYYPSGSTTLTSLLSVPQSMALDPSGNIWVVNSTSSGSNPNSIVEIIGAAAPTTTPLASAVCTGTVGCIGYQP